MAIDSKLPTPLPPYRPLSNVTPFTYRDGATYLELLENLRTFINKVIENENAQNDHIDEVLEAQNQTISELLSQLVGYTIEVTDYYYTASMMDGGTFTAYTNEGVDREIQILSEDVDVRIESLKQYVDESVETLEVLVEGKVATLKQYVDDEVVSLTTFVNEQVDTIRAEVASKSDTAHAMMTHKSITVRNTEIPYTVIRVANNGDTIANHIQMRLAVPGDIYEGRMSLRDFAARDEADIVINTFGFTVDAGVSGLVIRDGEVLRPWRRADDGTMATMQDGTLRVFEEGVDSVDDILAAGVIDTFGGFGPLIVRNGVVRDIQSNPNVSDTWRKTVSARTIHGIAANGDYIGIVVSGHSSSGTGLTGNELGNLARREGCVDAVADDGGGSTQLYATGKYVRCSSDRGGQRPRRAAVEIKNVAVNEQGTKWVDMEPYLRSGFVAESPLYMKMEDDQYYLKGVIDAENAGLVHQETKQFLDLPMFFPPPAYGVDVLTMGRVPWEQARLRLSATRAFSINSFSDAMIRQIRLDPFSGVSTNDHTIHP